ncbi:pirin family protein [Pinisolibacter sp. B13]|nr:pirin family protein [Pinisolibacter aquiterrae]MBV5265919.1 pirin family protein [Pinisolibacter aquiterrae]
MAGLIDPFLGVDHSWISGPTFPPHPHAGFSAVSYLFLDAETGIDNRDSLGTRNLIRPGGLHWTAAGRGVVHEEVPAGIGKTTHMMQIFVNLPSVRQGDAPFTLSLAPEDVPVGSRPGVRVRVPLGEFAGARSPLTPPTDVTLLDVSLEADAERIVLVEAERNAFVMPVHGTVMVDGEPFDGDAPRLPIFPALTEPRAIALRAVQGNAKVAVFTGRPLRQPVHWRGPMAMASADALARALTAYQNGDFGALE